VCGRSRLRRTCVFCSSPCEVQVRSTWKTEVGFREARLTCSRSMQQEAGSIAVQSILHEEEKWGLGTHVRHILEGQTVVERRETMSWVIEENIQGWIDADLVQLVAEINRIYVVALQIWVHDYLNNTKEKEWKNVKIAERHHAEGKAKNSRRRPCQRAMRLHRELRRGITSLQYRKTIDACEPSKETLQMIWPLAQIVGRTYQPWWIICLAKGQYSVVGREQE